MIPYLIRNNNGTFLRCVNSGLCVDLEQSIQQVAMPIPEPDVTVAAGNVEKGAKIFKTKCAQCHNAEQVKPTFMMQVMTWFLSAVAFAHAGQ